MSKGRRKTLKEDWAAAVKDWRWWCLVAFSAVLFAYNVLVRVL